MLHIYIKILSSNKLALAWHRVEWGGGVEDGSWGGEKTGYKVGSTLQSPFLQPAKVRATVKKAETVDPSRKELG